MPWLILNEENTNSIKLFRARTKNLILINIVLLKFDPKIKLLWFYTFSLFLYMTYNTWIIFMYELVSNLTKICNWYSI